MTRNTPPYRETGVAIPLSHCVSCSIADYRCYTPTSFPDLPKFLADRKNCLAESSRAKICLPGISSKKVFQNPWKTGNLSSRIVFQSVFWAPHRGLINPDLPLFFRGGLGGKSRSYRLGFCTVSLLPLLPGMSLSLHPMCCISCSTTCLPLLHYLM